MVLIDSCYHCYYTNSLLYTGTSDPYVKIRLGRQKHKSRIINHNLNPVWNESFSYTTNDLNELMVFKVYDHDWGSLDDFMGRATVKLTTLNQTESVESVVVTCCHVVLYLLQ